MGTGGAVGSMLEAVKCLEDEGEGGVKDVNVRAGEVE